MREIAELPVPRSSGMPAQADGGLARPTVSLAPPGDNRFEQLKAIFAVIGVVAVAFHGLRLFAMASR